MIGDVSASRSSAGDESPDAYWRRLGCRQDPCATIAPGSVFANQSFVQLQHALFKSLRASTGGLTLLTGPEGVGKTTFLQTIVDALRTVGETVIFHRCGPDRQLLEADLAAVVNDNGKRNPILLLDGADAWDDAALEIFERALTREQGPPLAARIVAVFRSEDDPRLKRVISLALGAGFPFARLRVDPLEPGSGGDFLLHRMRAAGYAGTLPVSPEVMKRIEEEAGRLPGRMLVLSSVELARIVEQAPASRGAANANARTTKRASSTLLRGAVAALAVSIIGGGGLAYMLLRSDFARGPDTGVAGSGLPPRTVSPPPPSVAARPSDGSALAAIPMPPATPTTVAAAAPVTPVASPPPPAASEAPAAAAAPSPPTPPAAPAAAPTPPPATASAPTSTPTPSVASAPEPPPIVLPRVEPLALTPPPPEPIPDPAVQLVERTAASIDPVLAPQAPEALASPRAALAGDVAEHREIAVVTGEEDETMLEALLARHEASLEEAALLAATAPIVIDGGTPDPSQSDIVVVPPAPPPAIAIGNDPVAPADAPAGFVMQAPPAPPIVPIVTENDVPAAESVVVQAPTPPPPPLIVAAPAFDPPAATVVVQAPPPPPQPAVVAAPAFDPPSGPVVVVPAYVPPPPPVVVTASPATPAPAPATPAPAAPAPVASTPIAPAPTAPAPVVAPPATVTPAAPAPPPAVAAVPPAAAVPPPSVVPPKPEPAPPVAVAPAAAPATPPAALAPPPAAASATPRVPMPVAPRPAAPPPVATAQATQPSAPPPAAAQPAAPARPSPAALAQAARDVERGDAMMANGDIAAARLFYERAAAVGDRRAMTALARSYDPEVLGRLGVVGLTPNPERAQYWYKRAAEPAN